MLLHYTSYSIHEIQYEIELSEGTVLTGSCICPEQEAVFNCTVDGGATTVWKGSALENCSDGSIILRHSQFNNEHTISKTCGISGQVIGQGISVENGSYTSQLILSITQQIIGSNIACTADGENNYRDIQITPSAGM